jgi:hypothetical protein
MAAGDGLGELAQHVVRRGQPAVDDPGRERLEARLHRVEGKRDHCGGEHRQAQVGRVRVPDHGAAAEHDDDVHHRDEQGQPTGNQEGSRQLTPRTSVPPS